MSPSQILEENNVGVGLWRLLGPVVHLGMSEGVVFCESGAGTPVLVDQNATPSLTHTKENQSEKSPRIALALRA